MPPKGKLCDEFYRWVEPYRVTYLALRNEDRSSDGRSWLYNDFKPAYMAMPFANPKSDFNRDPDGSLKLTETTPEELFNKKVATYMRAQWQGVLRQEAKPPHLAKPTRAPKAIELFAAYLVEDDAEKLSKLTEARLSSTYSTPQDMADHRLSTRLAILSELFGALPDDEREKWKADAEDAKAKLKALRASPEELAKKQLEFSQVLGEVLTKHVGSHQLGTMVVYAMGMYKDAVTGERQIFKVGIESGGRDGGGWFNDEGWQTAVHPHFLKYASDRLDVGEGRAVLRGADEDDEDEDEEDDDEERESSSASKQGGKRMKSAKGKSGGAPTTSAVTKRGASRNAAALKNSAPISVSDDESDEGGVLRDSRNGFKSGSRHDKDEDSDDALDATPGRRLEFVDRDDAADIRDYGSLSPSPPPRTRAPAKKPAQKEAEAEVRDKDSPSPSPPPPPKARAKKTAQKGGRSKKVLTAEDDEQDSRLSTSPPPTKSAAKKPGQPGTRGQNSSEGSSGKGAGAGAGGTATTSGNGRKRSAPDEDEGSNSEQPPPKKRASVGNRELQSLGANLPGRRGRSNRAAGGARMTRSKQK